MRIAIVTGGSTGIGAALARALTASGWHCILLARNLERLQELAHEIGGEAEACDVSNRAEVDQVAARIAERHPAVHLLVNNAGIPARGTFLELPPERIEQVLRTNYLGGVWCVRAFLPLLEAAAQAQVVNVVSIAGLVTGGAYGPYAAAKHAQLAFSRAIARELAPSKISVLTVNPGPVETEGFPQRDLRTRRLAGRAVLQPEEVAERIVKALERGRTEIVLPRYLRAVALAEAVAPTVISRLLSRGAGRTGALRGRGRPPQ
jgi:short-subunit dehydrogenase